MRRCILVLPPLYILSKRIDSAALQCFWLSYERNYLVSYFQIFRLFCFFILYAKAFGIFFWWSLSPHLFSKTWRQVQCFCLLSIFYQSFIILLLFFLLCSKFLAFLLPFPFKFFLFLYLYLFFFFPRYSSFFVSFFDLCFFFFFFHLLLFFFYPYLPMFLLILCFPLHHLTFYSHLTINPFSFIHSYSFHSCSLALFFLLHEFC